MDNQVDNKAIILGEIWKRGDKYHFGILDEDRDTHMYIIGQTGTGKSSLIELMVLQEIKKKNPCIVLDPHGSLVNSILELVEEEDRDDVFYLDPTIENSGIGMNIIESVDESKKDIVIGTVVEAIKNFSGNELDDATLTILNQCISALIDAGDKTLLDIPKMLFDIEFRKSVLEKVKDNYVIDFWEKSINSYDKDYIKTVFADINIKISQFTNNKIIRNMICSPKTTLNFEHIMNGNKTLLINLAKGKIGIENAKTLGAIFTTKIYLTALSRADLNKEELDNLSICNFYVDEFQSFTNSYFSQILSEARKFKLNLIMANQYLDQLKSENETSTTPGISALSQAIIGNAGSLISFRVSPTDESIILDRFSANPNQKGELQSLKRREMRLSISVNGAPSSSFKASTIDLPIPKKENFVEYIKKRTIDFYSGGKE